MVSESQKFDPRGGGGERHFRSLTVMYAVCILLCLSMISIQPSTKFIAVLASISRSLSTVRTSLGRLLGQLLEPEIVVSYCRSLTEQQVSTYLFTTLSIPSQPFSKVSILGP